MKPTLKTLLPAVRAARRRTVRRLSVSARRKAR